jgi:hypothetical protein
MNIEILDASVEARIHRQMQTMGTGSAEEQDRWLLENRTAVNAKIRRGLHQMDRGEGIPEDQLDAYLAKLKVSSE